MIDSLKRPTLLTLAMAVAVAGGAQAAETMDHGAMGHGQMNHGQMDHGTMDHGQMQHGQMDHGAMDHSQMNHGEQPAKTDGYGSRSPIPAPTAADRAAAFPALPAHTMHAGGINSFFLMDQLEYQDADDASVLSWDASGWIGGDINRLWFRSEGERGNGTTEEAELQAFYGRAISPWWEVVTGVRQDFKPGSPQTWAAFGVQGMPLYGLETKATAYLGEGSQSALRLEAEYDILLTNRLILQPAAEVNFYGRNDHERGVGSGLGNTELGLRLRYEFTPQFAPYIGVNWNRNYGNTADFAREEGDDNDEARFVAGIRFWF
ncbi:copper resistance protein B [Pseudomonas sp. BN414]|uniref:copper resistance protein B n=1 Tax=Pseudomonas sp. BN414 TaxID=2567888 RepID=UPI0024573253|nr:copper resistance protein B [Pseudomonas sp. BN414]MDH4566793.1 copper resistance protein B [Pseudomonas sp. BN414]